MASTNYAQKINSQTAIASKELAPTYAAKIAILKSTLKGNTSALNTQKSSTNQNFDTEVASQNSNNKTAQNNYNNTISTRGLGANSNAGAGIAEMNQVNNKYVGAINQRRTKAMDNIDSNLKLQQSAYDNNANTMANDKRTVIDNLARNYADKEVAQEYQAGRDATTDSHWKSNYDHTASRDNVSDAHFNTEQATSNARYKTKVAQDAQAVLTDNARYDATSKIAAQKVLTDNQRYADKAKIALAKIMNSADGKEGIASVNDILNSKGDSAKKTFEDRLTSLDDLGKQYSETINDSESSQADIDIANYLLGLVNNAKSTLNGQLKAGHEDVKAMGADVTTGINPLTGKAQINMPYTTNITGSKAEIAAQVAKGKASNEKDATIKAQLPMLSGQELDSTTPKSDPIKLDYLNQYLQPKNEVPITYATTDTQKVAPNTIEPNDNSGNAAYKKMLNDPAYAIHYDNKPYNANDRTAMNAAIEKEQPNLIARWGMKLFQNLGYDAESIDRNAITHRITETARSAFQAGAYQSDNKSTGNAATDFIADAVGSMFGFGSLEKAGIAKFGQMSTLAENGISKLTGKVVGDYVSNKIANKAIQYGISAASTGTEFAGLNATETSLQGGNTKQIAKSAGEGFVSGALWGAGGKALGDVMGKTSSYIKSKGYTEPIPGSGYWVKPTETTNKGDSTLKNSPESANVFIENSNYQDNKGNAIPKWEIKFSDELKNSKTDGETKNVIQKYKQAMESAPIANDTQPKSEYTQLKHDEIDQAQGLAEIANKLEDMPQENPIMEEVRKKVITINRNNAQTVLEKAQKGSDVIEQNGSNEGLNSIDDVYKMKHPNDTALTGYNGTNVNQTSGTSQTVDNVNAPIGSNVQQNANNEGLNHISDTAKKVDTTDNNGVSNSEEMKSIKVNSIGVDPKRFQFKENTDSETGTTDKLKGTDKFVKSKAGAITVWQDNQGKNWVVNGHHRLELAQRTNTDSVNALLLKESDGITDKKAREIGAMQNIAEGQGTPKDAAQIFRDGNYTVDDLKKQGLSTKDKSIVQGYNIAQLNDRLYHHVVNKNLDYDKASMIGSEFPNDSKENDANQNAVMDYIQKNNPNKNELHEAIYMIKGSQNGMVNDVAENQQMSLDGLGTSDVMGSNFADKMKLISQLKHTITSNKNVFNKVINKSDILNDAGNTLNTVGNAKKKEILDNVLKLIDQGKGKKGDPINDILNTYASKIGSEGLKLNSAVEKATSDITDYLGKNKNIAEKINNSVVNDGQTDLFGGDTSEGNIKQGSNQESIATKGNEQKSERTRVIEGTTSGKDAKIDIDDNQPNLKDAELKNTTKDNFVYHGTNKKFKQFDNSFNKKSTLYGDAFYFTDSLESANNYATTYQSNVGEGRVIKATLKHDKMWDYNNDKITPQQFEDIFNYDGELPKITKPTTLGQLKGVNSFTSELKELGYDGFKILEKDGSNTYAVFNPEQITVDKKNDTINKLPMIKGETSGTNSTKIVEKKSSEQNKISDNNVVKSKKVVTDVPRQKLETEKFIKKMDEKGIKYKLFLNEDGIIHIKGKSPNGNPVNISVFADGQGATGIIGKEGKPVTKVEKDKVPTQKIKKDSGIVKAEDTLPKSTKSKSDMTSTANMSEKPMKFTKIKPGDSGDKIPPKKPLYIKPSDPNWDPSLEHEVSSEYVDNKPLPIISGKNDKATSQNIRDAFIGKRNGQIAAGNHLADTMKKLAPNEQEGIQLFIDAGGNMNHLRDMTDHNDPIMDSYIPNTKITYRDGYKQALNLSPNAMKAVEMAEKYYKESKDYALKTGAINVGRENYANRMWVKPPRGVKTDIRNNGINPNTSHGKQRVYDNISEGLLNGKQPATLKANDLLAIHNQEMSYANTTRELATSLETSGLGSYSKNVPEGFKNVIGLDKHVPTATGYEVRPFVLPENLANGLRAITDSDLTKKIDSMRGIQKYQGVVKTMDLAFSTFHHITLAAQALYNNKGGIDFIRHWNDLHLLDSPEFQVSEKDFARHTGTTSKLSSNIDTLSRLTTTGSKMDKITNLPILKQGKHLIEANNNLLFGKIQRWLKVTDYQNKVLDFASKHPETVNADLSKAKISIAKEVNLAYGGLNWQSLGKNPSALGTERMLLLAPDWTESSVRMVGKAFEKGPGGNAARSQYITGLVAGGLLTEGLNYLFTGHLTDKNPKGHELQLQVQPDVYISLFRSGIGDFTKLVSNVVTNGVLGGVSKSLQGKLSPFLRTGVGWASNTDYLGRKISNPDKTGSENDINILKYILSEAGPIPFGVPSTFKYNNETPSSGVQKVIGNALVGSGAGTYAKAATNSSYDSSKKSYEGNWLREYTAPSNEKKQIKLTELISENSKTKLANSKALNEELGNALKDNPHASTTAIFDKYDTPSKERSSRKKAAVKKLKESGYSELQQKYDGMTKSDRKDFYNSLSSDDRQLIKR